MIGKLVLVRYYEKVGEEMKPVEATGHIEDKVRVSVLQDGHVLENDNYLIRKEDGTTLLMHPTFVIKII
jgi:hypothetical protein